MAADVLAERWSACRREREKDAQRPHGMRAFYFYDANITAHPFFGGLLFSPSSTSAAEQELTSFFWALKKVERTDKEFHVIAVVASESEK